MKLRQWHLVGLVILAAIMTATWFAYWTVWEQAFCIWVPCFSGISGIVLALVAKVRQRTRAETSSEPSKVSQGLLLVSIFLILQFAYVPLVLGIRNLEVRRAQDFIDTLIPRVEAYKREHNSYPATLQPVLTGEEEFPRLLQLSSEFSNEFDNQQFYFQQGDTYGFRFHLPDGSIGFHYEYCCGANGEWTITD